MTYKGFIEILPDYWYEESTGWAWSSKRFGRLKRLKCNPEGYIKIRIDKVNTTWSQVVYKFFNGRIPEGKVVDHKNNIRMDNKISNLQLLSNKDNSRKQLKNKRNSTGYPGVSFHKKSRKYQTSINVNGKYVYLGSYDKPDEAYQAYLRAKIKYHGLDSITPLM